MSRNENNDAEANISDADSKSKKQEPETEAQPTKLSSVDTGQRTLKVSIDRIPTKSRKTESTTK